jgi:hypothetical protein
VAGHRSSAEGRALPAAFAIAILLLCHHAFAGTLLICRTFDIASPSAADLVIPAGSIFRDNGRADDPLASLGEDRWQLRLETIATAILPPLQQCARVLARVTSDSSVKAVASADDRALVYVGSSNLLDTTAVSEDLLTLKASVLDQIQ